MSVCVHLHARLTFLAGGRAGPKVTCSLRQPLMWPDPSIQYVLATTQRIFDITTHLPRLSYRFHLHEPDCNTPEDKFSYLRSKFYSPLKFVNIVWSFTNNLTDNKKSRVYRFVYTFYNAKQNFKLTSTFWLKKKTVITPYKRSEERLPVLKAHCSATGKWIMRGALSERYQEARQLTEW